MLQCYNESARQIQEGANMKLSGKVSLIIGTARGIGKAIASTLVIIVSDFRQIH